MKSIFLAGAVLGAIAFGSAVHARDNVLLIIADDMGVEALGCYGIGRDTAPTPNIDALCRRGWYSRVSGLNPRVRRHERRS